MDEKTGSDRNSGQIALTVLVVLAIVASIIMLFTNNDVALKLALLAALWAAIIGFFLVYRYRNQAREATVKAELREEIHAQELEKARAHDETNDVLAELKEEIAGLRKQLEELSGQPIGYEPSAIRANARRILEVESPSERLPGEIRVVTDTEPAAKGETGKTRRTPSVKHSTGRHAAPAPSAGSEHPELRVVETAEPEERGQGLPSRKTPAADDTTEQSVVADSPAAKRRAAGAPSADAVAGRLGQQPSGPNPLSALINEKSRRDSAGQAAPRKDAEPSAQQNPAVTATPAEEQAPAVADAAEPATEENATPAVEHPDETKGAKPEQPASGVSHKAEQPQAESTPEPAATPTVAQKQEADVDKQPAPAETERPARRGRRRRDENSSGISVAELMKNLEDRR